MNKETLFIINFLVISGCSVSIAGLVFVLIHRKPWFLRNKGKKPRTNWRDKRK